MNPPDPLSRAFDGLAARADRMDVSLSAAQVARLRRHFALVLERNEVMNLTRVTDPEEAIAKLYLSSLAVIPGLRSRGVMTEGLFRALDLGTGAGFPGVPLAVACPHLSFVLLDARRKKVDFLAEVIRDLDLANAEALHGRAGELSRTRPDLGGAFDLVTTRAVASAAECVAEAADLLVSGGILVVHKGPGLTPEEIGEGRQAAEKHGLVFQGIAEPEVEDLSPRLLVYSRWSSRDEGLFDG